MPEQESTQERGGWHETALQIPFKSAAHAAIARRVILVDRELNAHLVERTIVVEENILVATYKTATARLLRLATNGFFENLQLVIRTIQEFAPPSASSSHSSTLVSVTEERQRGDGKVEEAVEHGIAV